jgi:CRP-like cAMP-binding protein
MVLESVKGDRVISSSAATAPNAAETMRAQEPVVRGVMPSPAPIIPPAPAPVPEPAPIVTGTMPAPPAPAAEVIELGPADVSPHEQQTVESAVQQAMEDLKAGGADADVLDDLFDDVGEIPQVPPTPLFSDLQPAEFERLIELLNPIRVPEGTDICREGEPAQSMFVIAQGSVQVYFTDEAGTRVPLAKLVEGDFFGEFALFEGGVRKASVVSLEETELLELSKENFDRVVAEFPAAAGVLRMFYYARLADTFLAKSPIFGALNREARWEFVRRMTLQRYNAGQLVLREGETGDALYMIRAGSVRIMTGSEGEQIALADLPEGEIFGEIAVINLQPRTATVHAVTDVELYRLDRESARKLLSGNASIATKIKEIAEARVRRTIDAMITGSVGNTGR